MLVCKGAMYSAKVCMHGILAMGKGKTLPSTGGNPYWVFVHGLKFISQAHSAVPVSCWYQAWCNWYGTPLQCKKSAPAFSKLSAN